MRLLIISDMFSLDSWLIDNQEPQIMPAVYELFRFLGDSDQHSFDAIMIHPNVSKLVTFPNGSTIEIVKLGTPMHYVRKLHSMYALYRKGQQKIDANKYDIVYGMTIYANLAKRLGAKNDIPSVARLFGSLVWDSYQKKQWLKLYTRFIFQIGELRNPCDLIISTEDGTQVDKALDHYAPNAKYHLLYNGINDDLRNRLLRLPIVEIIDANSPIRMIYIARYTQWKRQDLAIQWVDILINKYKLNIQLDLYGKGETQAILEKQIDSMQLQDHIHIKGSIDHKNIPEILSDYQVALHFYDASNLGNAMWETALSGRWIVTRNTGKTPEIFNDNNAWIMQDEDIKSLADAFYHSLNKRSDRSSKSRNMVNGLLPTWPDRINHEMDLIEGSLLRK